MAEDESAKILQFRRLLEASEAIQLVREAVANTGQMLGWSDHVWVQMRKRQIVNSQVLTVLAEGGLIKGPTWDEEYDDWACVLKKFVAGRSVHVVVGVHEVRREVTIVTAY